MIKNMLVNILIILALAAAYYANFFSWIAGRGALITAIVLVIAALIAALKILGNPFGKADDDDDK